MDAPALLLAVPLIAGVVTGALVAPHAEIAIGIAAVSTLAAVIAYLRRAGRFVLWAAVGGACGAGLVIGARADRDARTPSLLAAYHAGGGPERPVHLRGTLDEDASPGPQAVGLRLNVLRLKTSFSDTPVSGGVRVSVLGALAPAAAGQWRQGRTLETDAVLREPLDYRDPGVPSDRERLARQGTVLLGTIKSAALVSVAAAAPWYAELAAATRAFVRRAVLASVGAWSERSAGVVTAILIGDRSGLDPSDERRLQDAGTYHVIAISGGNIALLTLLLVVCGRALRFPARWTAAASIGLLAFYGYLAGLAPSILRATLAGAIYLAGRAIDRRGAALNALGVAAAIAAATAPLSVIDPGFILSFGATTAIVVAASRLLPARVRAHDASRGRRWMMAALRAAGELGAATLCAEIALAPVGARLFGRVSVAGLALNFIAIPLMSIIQIAGMVAIALEPIAHRVALAAGWIAHAGTVGLLESATLVDLAPWLVRDVPPPPWALLGAWYAGWLAVLIVRRVRVQLGAAVVIVVCGVLMLWAPPWASTRALPPPAPGWSRVVFLDVGQGDAALVWPDGGEPFFVDAGGVPGGAFDVGRRVTVPAAWALGARRLSRLVLTHGDPDHIGGAPAVLRALRPAEVWEGIPVPRHPGLQEVRARVAAAHVPWRDVRAGDVMPTGAAIIRVIHPPAPDWERPKVRNDDSLVLEIRIGALSIVLPGDISASVEPLVSSRLTRAPLTILKAPHHGSGGSSSAAFIAATHPAAVIVSAGRRNPFGHPAPPIVERYRAAGASIFRTDEDGAVFVDTDGAQVVIWTWASGRRTELTVPAVR